MTTTPDAAEALRAAPFVLADRYPDGRPKYFKVMTPIGPAATPELAEAARFSSRQAAMLSPAYSHWSSFYEPKEVAHAGR